MPEANAEMLTQLYPPAKKYETAENHSILELYVLTAIDNDKDDITEKDGDADVDNKSEINEEEINSESKLAAMEDDDDDDITEVDTITKMITSTVMNSEVEANSEPEFEEKDANTENNVDATAKMDCNANTDKTQQRPKVPSYASISIDGTIKINGVTVMKDFVPVEGIPKADETEKAKTRGPNGKGKGPRKDQKGTKTKRLVKTETQVKAAEIDTGMPMSEEDRMNAKLQKKCKKGSKEMCPVCKIQAENTNITKMLLYDLLSGEEGEPAIALATKYLN